MTSTQPIELRSEDPAEFKIITNSSMMTYNKLSNKQLPQIPLKPLLLSIFLTICGLILIIVGFIGDATKHTPGGGTLYWIGGFLVIIPGVFYGIKIFYAWRSNDPEERARIIDDIDRKSVV